MQVCPKKRWEGKGKGKGEKSKENRAALEELALLFGDAWQILIASILMGDFWGYQVNKRVIWPKDLGDL